MKNRKLRTMKEIQEHNRMTSSQRLKHQYHWAFVEWLQDEHPFIALLLSAAMMAGVAAMIVWAFLHPYG